MEQENFNTSTEVGALNSVTGQPITIEYYESNIQPIFISNIILISAVLGIISAKYLIK